MRILYIEKVETKYNYYSDIINYLKKISELKVVYLKKNININNEITKFKPEIIFLGFSVTDCSESKPTFYIDNLPCPLYIILNKEYTGLKNKLEWIRDLRPTKVFTVHHDIKKYEEICKIPFCKIMWSANHDVFKKYDDDYKYDFFFSGVIRDEQTDNLRNKINNKMNLLKNYNILMKVAFFKNDKLIGKLNTFNLHDYANNIQNSKIVLTTTGPADLVGTRYFEIMASNKALILCNRMSIDIYEDIVIDKFNCVMFDDENDFIEKFKYYIKHEDERLKIVNQAHKHFLEKHTWDHKVKHLLDNL
jgi:spore maturation protein CgeB